ncbi:MAG: Fur family transcriptional regulator [Phycisphaerae bacterium]
MVRNDKTSEPAEPAVDQAWQEFADFLRESGARVTQARRIILERVASREDHFRADRLAEDLSAGPERVSRGTVYNTLALLVEAGMVRELRDTDRHSHYEYIHGRRHHEHMICTRCRTFIEFTDPEMGRIIDRACRERGFKQETRRVIVTGLCSKCRSEIGPR